MQSCPSTKKDLANQRSTVCKKIGQWKFLFFLLTSILCVLGFIQTGEFSHSNNTCYSLSLLCVWRHYAFIRLQGAVRKAKSHIIDPTLRLCIRSEFKQLVRLCGITLSYFIVDSLVTWLFLSPPLHYFILLSWNFSITKCLNNSYSNLRRKCNFSKYFFLKPFQSAVFHLCVCDVTLSLLNSLLILRISINISYKTGLFLLFCTTRQNNALGIYSAPLVIVTSKE